MKKPKLDAKTIEILISTILAIIFFTIFAIFTIFGLDTTPLVVIFPVIVIIGIILIAVISIIVVAVTKKKNTSKVMELINKNITNDLRLEIIYGTEKKLLIVAGYDIGDKHYKFISTYDGDGREFAKVVEDNSIISIRTWVDFINPKVYEFDLSDLFRRVGMSTLLNLSTTYATDDLESANDVIKVLKSTM